MKYKAKDIARELGVSPATVSLVLNNKPGVGEAKRREILEKIMEMDCEYLLKEGESHKGDIGLVIYKCGGQVVEEYPFFNYLSESITRTLEKNGYTMVVMYLDKGMPADEQCAGECGLYGLHCIRGGNVPGGHRGVPAAEPALRLS